MISSRTQTPVPKLPLMNGSLLSSPAKFDISITFYCPAEPETDNVGTGRAEDILGFKQRMAMRTKREKEKKDPSY